MLHHVSVLRGCPHDDRHFDAEDWSLPQKMRGNVLDRGAGYLMGDVLSLKSFVAFAQTLIDSLVRATMFSRSSCVCAWSLTWLPFNIRMCLMMDRGISSRWSQLNTRTIIRTTSMIFSMMRSTTCRRGRSLIYKTVKWWKRFWVKKCIISMISSILWGTGLSMIRSTSWRISPSAESSVLLERSHSWLAERVHRKTAEMRSYGMSIHCSRKSVVTDATKTCFSTRSSIRF